MIYLISNQKNLFETDLYQEISFEEARNAICKLNIIQFDTETSGLDPYTKKLLCYQLGNKENQYVFDQSSYSIVLFKDLFESGRLFIGHNIGFDLKWCYKYDIWPKHVYDTMLAEQLIWLGYSRRAIPPSEYKNEEYKFPYLKKENKQTHEPYYEYSCSLKAVGKNRLGIELDKTVRGKITKVGLTPEVIQYAGTDVMYLEDIKESQQIDIDRENLQKAVNLENEFVKVLAYIEFCGVKLDINKWKTKMAKDKAKLDEATKELNTFVINYFFDHNGNIKTKTINIEHIVDTQWIHDEEELKKYNLKLYQPSKNPKKYYTRQSNIEQVGLLYCEEVEFPFPWINQNLQGDLFEGFNTKPYCTINWSSPKQLIPFFELIGFKLDTFDKKTKEKKKSTDSDTIKSQKDICPELANAYVKYKEASKVCSSFGENWLKAVNPVTGRIHADFHQLGGDTARLSCGGGEASVNVQQLPKESETRACFISEEGNKFISEDYQS
jgi:DNA polymerase I-like protein with 3'-5' exonuclease and polymerase domains